MITLGNLVCVRRIYIGKTSVLHVGRFFGFPEKRVRPGLASLVLTGGGAIALSPLD
jgi:hypothetical protein